MTECGKCPHMRIESWPKGAQVARCFAAGNLFAPGRVINYSGNGRENFEHTPKPLWCRRENK